MLSGRGVGTVAARKARARQRPPAVTLGVTVSPEAADELETLAEAIARRLEA